MVIMTNPGERIMIPDFGVGIKTYLFENATQATFDEIEDEIRDQVSKYLPYMTINSIQFNSERGVNMSEIEASSASNYVNLQIRYSIPSSFISDELNLKI
jgi:phage baseplate assembly protein W